MYKSIPADKDTYITNKLVKSVSKIESNVGNAGTLDLFKLYGASTASSSSLELSRLLIHFDLTSIKELYENGKLDINDSSFWCKLNLSDVYGGQPTPSNFTISVFPLSASFDEGVGKDVSYYSDYDVSNWLSSSNQVPWFSTGCSLATDALTAGDYITSSINLLTTEKIQKFKTGLEDLSVDITQLISATLSNELPDSGFRISFNDVIENDTKTYFVKRFASRTAYDESKRPKLIVGFDDSIYDDTQNLTFDATNRLVFYNYSLDSLSNIISGSNQIEITGSNCIKLKLITEISGGTYEVVTSGSQLSYGNGLNVTGIYFSDFNLSSYDTNYKQKLLTSSSIKFTPVWSSNDLTVAYLTGSTIEIKPARRETKRNLKKYRISITDIKDSYYSNEEALLRVNIFDETSPIIKAVKLPVELPGIVIRDAYYQVRDAVTDRIVIPFDTLKNSTKISSDSLGMFLKLDVSNLPPGRTYTIDVLAINSGIKTEYSNASTNFRVINAE